MMRIPLSHHVKLIETELYIIDEDIAREYIAMQLHNMKLWYIETPKQVES